MSRDESAFPIIFELANDPRIQELGLTKREYYASQAMQGFLMGKYVNLHSHEDMLFVAQRSAQFAEALIAELEKVKK